MKRVADPIHGTIGLTEPEVRVLGTPSFLRLQGIKHLGMAHLVYPGADFSRFSHCLGVCHVTGRILDALRPVLSLSKQDLQLYRLAALLHDVGHYPFSHLTERAAKNYYANSYIERSSDDSEVEHGRKRVFSHERAGREVVENDVAIKEAITEAGVDPRRVTALFMHEGVGTEAELRSLASIISSDLDADRIDYLLRMSHNTGLPYGSVDLDYLLSQMMLDSAGKASISIKALRTVEHFLLQRLFAYQQIAYHKVVAGLELVLEQVIRLLFERRLLSCSADWVTSALSSGEWYDFTDGQVIEKIVELSRDLPVDSPDYTKVQCVLRRRPPKLVFEAQFFGDREDKDEFDRKKKAANQMVEQLSATFGFPRELLYVWAPAPVALTKVGARVPISLDAMPEEEIEQSIRIVRVSGGPSRKVQEFKRSLLGVLSEKMLYVFRIYALPPASWSAIKAKDIVEQMRTKIPQLNGLLSWEDEFSA